MRKVSIIFFPKRAFAGLDAYVPLMAHLVSRYSDRIIHDTVLVSDEITDEISLSSFHVKLVERYANAHRFELPNGIPVRFSVPYKAMRIILLMLWRRLTCRKVIVILGKIEENRRGRTLSVLSEWLGKSFLFHNTQAVITEAFERRMLPEFIDKQIELGIKRRSVIPDLLPRRVMCYVTEEFERLHRSRYPGAELEAIGLPRLMSTWPDVVATLGKETLEAELAAFGLAADTPTIVTIILTNPDYYWFPDNQTSWRLMDEAIHAVRQKYPEAPIFLKAKPSMVPRFEGWKEAHSSNNVHFTTLGLGALASRSVMAVTIQESTGIFDFLTMEIPTIEYSDYSDIFLEIYPERTPWKDLPGMAFCESPEALQKVIDSIHGGTFQVARRQELATLFGHVENLQVFGIESIDQITETNAPTTRADSSL